MATDFEAEGLLEGAGDERARRARLELLQSLEQGGFSLEELRPATAEDRLVLLPLERVLEGEGPRYTPEEIAERAGLDVRSLSDARRALGAPRAEPGERILTEEDLELAHRAKRLIDAGIGKEAFLAITRVMSQAMAAVAAAFATILGEALLRPGDTERDLGLRYAEAMRELWPLTAPALQQVLNLRMREQIRQAVVGQAELRSGHLPGAQRITVRFVDIVTSRTSASRCRPTSWRRWCRARRGRCDHACGRLVRPPRQPGEPPHRLCPARRCRDGEGGARRGGRGLRLVLRRQPPLQGRARRGGRLPRTPPE